MYSTSCANIHHGITSFHVNGIAYDIKKMEYVKNGT